MQDNYPSPYLIRTIAKRRQRKIDWRLVMTLLLLLLGSSAVSYAQTRVYYAVSDGSFTTTADQLRFVPLAGGTEQITVASGTTNYPASPGSVAYDAANNRLFVANIISASPYIAAVDATTGSVSSFLVPAAINGTGARAITGMAVDNANGYLYYAVSDNAFGQYTDQLRRIPLTGGAEQIVVGSNTLNYPATPGALALDLPNNRLLVLNGVSSNTNSGVSNLYISAVNLTTFAVSVFTSPAIIPGASATTLGGIAVDNVNNYLYYSLRDNAVTTFNDQLRRVSLAGGSEQTVVNVNSNVSGFPTSPGALAYDAASNRVLVQDISINNREIAVVNPANGDSRELLNNGPQIGSGNTSITGFAIGASVAAPPTVVTNLATSVTTTSALLSGSVTADGAASVTGRGVVYSTSNSSPSLGGSNVTQAANGSGTGTFSATISGLTPGSRYYVRAYATNAVGTSYGAVVSFTTAPALTSSGSQTNVSCNGSSTGQASVSMTGGVAPYSYDWTPGTPTGDGTTSVTNLIAGTYTVTVTDASGATLQRAFTITQPAALTATTTQINASTAGGTDGSATLTVSGGAPSYTYTWNPNVSTTATAANLRAGTYTATATDAYGCTITRTFTITQPTVTAAPVVTTPANGSLLNNRLPTYSGTAPAGSTVTVYVNGTGLGTTTATGGSFSFSQSTDLVEGSHTVYATAQASGSSVSANSNTNTFTIDTTAPTVAISSSAGPSGSTTMTSPWPFTVTFSESVVGFTDSDVTISNGTLNGFSGGGTTYTFSVTPASTGTVTVNVATFVAQDAAGNGNTASTSFTLQYAPLTAPTVTTTAASSITATAATLGGNVTADGGATVTERGVVYVAGNSTPTTASTKVQSGTGIGSFSQRITGLTAGSLYTVRAYATNVSGTSYGASVTFTTGAVLASSGSQTNVSCNGEATGAASMSVTGGVTPYSYDWTPGTPTGDGTNAIVGLTARSYTVTVTDASGATITRSFAITQPAALTAATTQTNVTTNGGNNGAATITVSGGTPTYTYSWSPNVSTTATASNLSAGTYTVTATDVNGCTIARSFTITQPAPTKAAPVVTAPANGSLLNTAAPAYAGTAPPNSTVTVYVDATSIGTTTATGIGDFRLIQPTSLAEGSHTVYATAQDGSGTVSATSNTNTFMVDTTAPTVAISSAAGSSGSSTSTSPLSFTVTFSESVTDFAAGGVRVTGGTLSGFSGNGTAYSFTVTPPTTGGEVTVNVAVNVAQDAAGNGNVAAMPFSLRYVLPVTATTWTGGVSTDWFTADNWTAGVPTSTLDALIPVVSSGNYPAVAAGSATARTLILNSSAQLTQNGGTLTLTSDFVNNGTFATTGGQVVLASSALQNVGGSSTTRFFNLTVGAAGARLSGPAELRRVLTLNGDLTTNAQPFTLLSTAPTETGMVINNAGRVIGTATVQRAIDGSLNPGAGYRHYSSPVASTTVADLTTSSFSPVVNPAYNTVGTSVQPFPTVYGYDEARLSGSSSTTQAFEYGYFSPSSLSDPLVRGRGYTVNLNASNTVDLVGTLNTGSIPVGALARGTGANAGWHLLGNPYPAPLDWSKARLTLPAGVIDAVYVYKSIDQYRGTYQFYQNGFGTLPDGLIGSMQGFFVRVSQPVAAFNFLDTWRSTTDQSTTFNRPEAEKRTAVQVDLVSATGVHEPTFVYFEAGATAALDDHYDAAKLPNTTGLNLSSLASEASLAVNGLPLLTTPTTVPLAVGVPLTGTYTLHAAALQNVEATDVYLHDAVTGQQINLKQRPSYTFTASNVALLTDRFSLHFSPLRPLATQAGSRATSLSVYPNPARQQFTLQVPAVPGATTATATLYNMLGQSVREITLPLSAAGGRTTVDVHELPTGVYVLRVQVGGTTLTKQLLVE